MINILLAEDHVLLRDGLKLLLMDQPGMQVVAEANNGKEVQQLLVDTKINVAILDINMPDMDGIQTAEYISRTHKDVKIIMLSMLDNENYVNKSFQAGAVGYILKNTGKEEFINAIKLVMEGHPYISHKISALLVQRIKSDTIEPSETDIHLSGRELEILNYIAEGYTNGEIAEKTFTSKRTVETHRKNLIEKTGTKNTASLIKYAILNGILK